MVRTLAAASLLTLACIVPLQQAAAQDAIGGAIFGGAAGALLGGAIGNLVDRLRLGYVVDFDDIGIGDVRFYTFNLADSAISTSIVLLVAVAVIPGLARLADGATDG